MRKNVYHLANEELSDPEIISHYLNRGWRHGSVVQAHAAQMWSSLHPQNPRQSRVAVGLTCNFSPRRQRRDPPRRRASHTDELWV